MNEEVVCTPDLVVSNFQLDELNKYPPGTRIHIREPLLLIPPIETDVQDNDCKLTENFREIMQYIIKTLSEMTSTIWQIEKQLDNISEEAYLLLRTKFINEVNRTICSLNITKSRLFVDHIKEFRQLPSTSKDNLPSVTASTEDKVTCSDYLIKKPIIDKNIDSNSPLIFTENVPKDPIKSQYFMLNDEISHSVDVQSLDSQKSDELIEKKNEIHTKRRKYDIEQKLMKQMKTCKVKLKRDDLEELRLKYLKNQVNYENSYLKHNQFRKVPEVVKQDLLSFQSPRHKRRSILVISPNINRSKTQKKVTFATDVINK